MYKYRGYSQSAAHSFTTGSRSGGYNLQSVRIPIHVLAGRILPSGTTTVSIHADDNERPGASLHLLSHSSYPSGIHVIELDATNINLSADTTYWLTFNAIGGQSPDVLYTWSTEEHGAEGSGWSIGDLSLYQIRTLNGTPSFSRSGHRGFPRIMSMEVVEARSVANSAPVISTPAGLTVGENVTEVATLAATDEYIPTEGLVWTIRSGTDGGADRDRFVLSEGGVLLFDSPKNFEAKDDANGDGVYEVSVQVSDEATTTARSLRVTLVDTNETPVTDAGADQADVAEGAVVTLSGTGSDPDAGDPAGTLSYRWRQTDGSSEHHVTLVDANTATTTFTAPGGLLEDAMLGFVLTVTDDEGLSTDDEVSVSVTARGPVAEEGLVGNLGQDAGSTLTIASGGVSYAQAFTTGPVNSRLRGVRLSTSVDSGTVPMVSIHAGGDGRPGSRIRTLDNPEGLDGDTATVEEFTTSTLVLQASSTYWVVATRASGGGAVGLGTASSAAEDGGRAAGWTVTGTAWQRSGRVWSEVPGSRAIKLAITGEENPYVLSWAVSSRPMSGSTYRAGENLELEFTFNEPVITDNLMRAHLWVGPPDRTVSFRSSRYAWGSGTRKLVFAYKVQERDGDEDGFSAAAGFLRGVGPVTDHSGEVGANLYVPAGEAGTGHKVDGSGQMGCPMVLCATVTVAQQGDANTLGAGHYDSGNVGNISNRVFYYEEDNYPGDDQAYVLMEVLLRDRGQLEVLLNRPPGRVLLEEVRLEVGERAFLLRNGLVHGSRVTWRNTGLSWAAGDKVSIMVTDHTVVGNVLQDNAGRLSASSGSPALAQSFTTGSHASGYVLLSARLPMNAYPGAIPTVSVHSDDSGAPGRRLHQLSRRPWFVYGSFIPNNYTSSDFMLDPDTTYWLVVEKLADKRDPIVLVTESANEDRGAASGWSLGDAGQVRSGGTWSALTGTADTIQMAILAMKANRPATGSPVVEGSMRVNEPLLADTSGIYDPDGLTGPSYSYQWMIKDENGEAEAIPGATGASYTPGAADMGRRLRVRVAFNDDFGNTEELTSQDSPLVGVMVSNMGQPYLTGWLTPYQTIDNWIEDHAQRFTTGGQAGGYTLHSVLLRTRGPKPNVSIYSDNGGKPGTSLHVLTAPTRAVNQLEFVVLPFTATNFTLQPNTDYWMVTEGVGGANRAHLTLTAYTAEDEGSAPGWSIANERASRYSHHDYAIWEIMRFYPLVTPSMVRIAVLAE